MKVMISGRHVEVTKAMREFIEKKAVKIEEFFPGVRQVKVILEVQKYRHTAEIVFKAARKTVTAKKTTKDMYASIEEVLHAVERQANKRKEKLYSTSARRHRGVDRKRKQLEDEAPLLAPKAKKKAPVRKKASGPKVAKLRLTTSKVMFRFGG